jgi:hypothetical protein
MTYYWILSRGRRLPWTLSKCARLEAVWTAGQWGNWAKITPTCHTPQLPLSHHLHCISHLPAVRYGAMDGCNGLTSRNTLANRTSITMLETRPKRSMWIRWVIVHQHYEDLLPWHVWGFGYAYLSATICSSIYLPACLHLSRACLHICLYVRPNWAMLAICISNILHAAIRAPSLPPEWLQPLANIAQQTRKEKH